MQWSRNPRCGTKIVAAAVGAEEMKRIVPSEKIVDSRAAAKVEKIRATAHRHVLAMVNQLTAPPIEVRSGSSPKLAAGLEQFPAAAALDQRHGGGQSRQA